MTTRDTTRPDNAQKSNREGVIHCTKEVRGKRVKSIYVSAVDNFNVVNIDFMDGTAVTVAMAPAIKLKVEYNDWTVPEGKLLQEWPLLISR